MRETKIYSTRKNRAAAFFFVILSILLIFLIYAAVGNDKEVSDKVFSQQLPVIVIDTNGQIMDDTPLYSEEMVQGNSVLLQENTKRYKASFNLYNSDPFKAAHALDSSIETDIIMNARGQSSLAYPKKQYTVRFVDDNEFENPQQVLNMPKHDKWILNGMYSDKSFMRNYLAYKMGRQTMDYSPRTRYVEVYLKTGENQSQDEQYQGIYLLTEKIERDKDRVNITKNDKKYQDVSFIMARDKIKKGDVTLQSDWNKIESESTIIKEDLKKMRTILTVSYPSKNNLGDAEKQSILNTINDFEYALQSDNFRDKREGYQKHIDIDSFIKYSMINEITKNIDGGEVSTYFYKDVGGKIVAGPLWDFDMSLGNTYDTEVNKSSGFLMLNRIWYERFFQDEFFAHRYKNIYKNYRRTIWSDANINLMIDEAVLEIEPTIKRNNEKWFPKDSVDDYFDEVESLRSFLLNRLNWMDENIESIKRITEGVTE